MLQNRLAATMATALGVAVLGVCHGALAQAPGQLTITSWGGTLQPVQRQVYFEPFARATGIRITEDSWGGELAKLRAMVQSGAISWDVVGIGTTSMEVACSEGLLEKIDYARFGGAARFLPGSTHECGVPTSGGSAVIAVNADKFTGQQPTTLADFFDVARFPGRRALRAGPRWNLEIALLADGVPLEKLYDVLGTEEGLARALRKLDTIKAHVVWFQQWAEAIQLLADGEVVMTMNGNARVTAAATQDRKNLRIIWDGQGFDYDYWAVLRGARNTENAMRFIAFASSDEPMRAFIERYDYGPTLVSVAGAMPPEMAARMPTAPENMRTAYRLSASFWGDHLDDYTVRFRAWLGR